MPFSQPSPSADEDDSALSAQGIRALLHAYGGEAVHGARDPGLAGSSAPSPFQEPAESHAATDPDFDDLAALASGQSTSPARQARVARWVSDRPEWAVAISEERSLLRRRRWRLRLGTLAAAASITLSATLAWKSFSPSPLAPPSAHPTVSAPTALSGPLGFNPQLAAPTAPTTELRGPRREAYGPLAPDRPVVLASPSFPILVQHSGGGEDLLELRIQLRGSDEPLSRQQSIRPARGGEFTLERIDLPQLLGAELPNLQALEGARLEAVLERHPSDDHLPPPRATAANPTALLAVLHLESVAGAAQSSPATAALARARELSHRAEGTRHHHEIAALLWEAHSTWTSVDSVLTPAEHSWLSSWLKQRQLQLTDAELPRLTLQH